MSDFEHVEVGREVRRGTRVSLPPTWPTRRPDRAGDDLAIVQLDRPGTSVRPVPIVDAGARLRARLGILGQGKTRRTPTARSPLRQATLKTLGDAACAPLDAQPLEVPRQRRVRGENGYEFSTVGRGPS